MDTAYVAVFIFWIRVDEKPYHQVHTDLDIKQKSTVQPVQVLISIRIINVYQAPGTSCHVAPGTFGRAALGLPYLLE